MYFFYFINIFSISMQFFLSVNFITIYISIYSYSVNFFIKNEIIKIDKIYLYYYLIFILFVVKKPKNSICNNFKIKCEKNKHTIKGVCDLSGLINSYLDEYITFDTSFLYKLVTNILSIEIYTIKNNDNFYFPIWK